MRSKLILENTIMRSFYGTQPSRILTRGVLKIIFDGVYGPRCETPTH